MQSEIRTVIGGVIFILVFAIFSALVIENYKPKTQPYEGSWACTTDVMICPDGREVQRTPPYCQFASC
ncbi:MAG: hypothetical protein NUV78_02895 [Candidatus Zambryskibacteria bacterium]|nr:hypothetical protein [Candidatus Zambryskibacteria bacterium]